MSTRLVSNDPQGGPLLLGRQLGFFHFAMSWILAEPGRIAGLHVSNYIRRDDAHAAEDVDQRTSGARATAYINRTRGAQVGELGGHVLVTRGLPVATGAELARLLDAAERKADRTYRCYGGRLPRVGSHVIASLTWSITPEQAAVVTRDYAHALSNRLCVPVEAQVHNKGGRPDHVHLIVGTRVVENGRLGRKARCLDAVSEKADGKAIQVGDRAIGATVEWMRADWARRMREASGDQQIDHRSYVRRAIPLSPVTPVPRSEIEYQRRRGSTAWRDARRLELEERNRPRMIDPVADVGAQGLDRARSQALWRATFLGEELPPDVIVPSLYPPPRRATPDAAPGRSNPARLEHGGAGTPVDLGLAVPERVADAAPDGVAGTEPRVGVAAPCVGPVPGSVSQPAPAAEAGPAVSGPGRREPDRRSPPGEPPPTTTVEPAHDQDGAPMSQSRAAVLIYAELKRAHRLDAERERVLADVAGLDRQGLRALAEPEVQSAQPPLKGLDVATTLPADLLEQWRAWVAGDAAKRRERRSAGKAGDAPKHGRIERGSLPPEALSVAQPEPHRDTPRAPADRVPPGSLSQQTEPAAGAAQPLVVPHHPGPATGPFTRRTATASHDRSSAEGSGQGHDAYPATALAAERAGTRPGSGGQPVEAAPASVAVRVSTPNGAGPAQPAGHAGARGPRRSATVDQATFAGFADDVREVARRRGAAAPSFAVVEQGVAFRLRATGRDSDEVLAILTAGAVRYHGEARGDGLARAVADAFSEAGTAWLQRNSRFIDRVRAVEARIEARLYRELRRQAMGKLKRDLDEVWAEGRMRADEAARHHARRLAIIQNVRWRTRHVGRSSGLALALAILSALVEVAMLRPLIAKQQALAAAERLAIKEATARASAEIKRLRTEWRTHVAEQVRRGSARGGSADGRPPAEFGFVGERVAAAAAVPSAGPPGSPEVEQRRQVVVDLALAMVARGSLSDMHMRRLGHSIGTDADGLRLSIRDACRRQHGHPHPDRLPPEVVARHWTDAWRGASGLGWAQVLRFMETMANDRGTDGKDNGQER